MKFRDRLQLFMRGRYGIDDLYNFLFKLYLILLVLNLFINSNILSVIELLIVVIIFYRFSSRKIYKRSNENQLYLKLRGKFLKPFKTLKNRLSDKNHIYKKCFKCKTVLKLPLPDKRGIKHAKCPTCKKRLTLLVLRKEKVEIIRNGRRKK